MNSRTYALIHYTLLTKVREAIRGKKFSLKLHLYDWYMFSVMLLDLYGQASFQFAEYVLCKFYGLRVTGYCYPLVSKKFTLYPDLK